MDRGPAFLADGIAKLDTFHQQAACRHGSVRVLLVKVINLLVEPCVEVSADVACRAEQIGVKSPMAHIMLDGGADQPVLVPEIAVQGRLRDAQRTRHFIERGRRDT